MLRPPHALALLLLHHHHLNPGQSATYQPLLLSFWVTESSLPSQPAAEPLTQHPPPPAGHPLLQTPPNPPPCAGQFWKQDDPLLPLSAGLTGTRDVPQHKGRAGDSPCPPSSSCHIQGHSPLSLSSTLCTPGQGHQLSVHVPAKRREEGFSLYFPWGRGCAAELSRDVSAGGQGGDSRQAEPVMNTGVRPVGGVLGAGQEEQEQFGVFRTGNKCFAGGRCKSEVK